MYQDRKVELLKTEHREIVSLLAISLRTVQFVLQEHCGKALGLYQQFSLFLGSPS